MADGKGFFWVGDANDQTLSPVKHRRKKKKLEFVGWGSKSLIEFLQSIGKDTGEKLSQYDVATIINEYVHTYNLLNPLKKKRVVCDERLRLLFSKNTVPRNKIHELLNIHFAENNDSSEDDDDFYNSEDYEDANLKYKKQKLSSLEKTDQKKKAQARLSRFAAIIPDNIKLLYLKRSLVKELLNHPDSFEGKLLGSYIRVKSDPMDFLQKNSHQLHPVTGVKNEPGNGVHEVLLQVPNMAKDISIHMLSDDDFSKEEVEDLCQRVKDGLLKRPTVVEFEQKAQILHEDITNHWLPRELAHLQNLIDRANEKGWRKELFEYLERRKQLQTPSEKSKLLSEVPKVTADLLDQEATPQDQEHDIEQRDTSPILIHGSDAAEHEVLVLDGVDQRKAEPIKKAGSEEHLTNFQWVETVHMPKTISFGQTVPIKKAGSEEHLTNFQWMETVHMPKAISFGQTVDSKTINFGQTVDLIKTKNMGSGEHLTSFQWVEAVQMPKTRSSGQTADFSKMSNVIDLCDDDVEETHKEQVVEKTHVQEDEYEITRPKWFYLDPQGQIQGPFSLVDLKCWNDAGYFMSDFKVWKEGQTPEFAVLLIDVLSSNHSK